MNKPKAKAFLWALLLLFPAVALGHTGEGSTGFMAGLLHPIKGLDHLLAMLCVGIVSAQMGGRSIWTVPSLFVIFMIVGGILGANNVGVPFVEVGIAISVIVLGLGIVVAHRWNVAPLMIMTFVAFFGMLHGHAHGVEMPRSASPFYYSFGFIASTSSIHLAGVLIGHTLISHDKLAKALTFVGASVASAGVFILYGLKLG